MRDVGEEENDIMKLYPYTVDELKAMDKMMILKLAIDRGEDVNGKIAKDGMRVENFDEQHEVFIEMFQTLNESPIKRKAIAVRYDLIKNKKEIMEAQAAQQAQMQGMPKSGTSAPTNSAANVATAQASATQAQEGK